MTTQTPTRLEEAVILAGGMGTRLRNVIQELPKPMAPVGDKPFLWLLLKQLDQQKFKKVVLSVGYLHEKILNYFGDRFNNLEISYSIERTPLGTGGALKLALEQCHSPHVLLLNGDSFIQADYQKCYKFHLENAADCTLITKKMQNYDRYGSLMLDANNKLTGFIEKKQTTEGYINAGAAILKSQLLSNYPSNQNFSLEKDFFESRVNSLHIYGFETQGKFIDIGIPEDYYRAEEHLKEFL